MSEQSMWAVQYGRYGGPEVLEIGRVPRPRPSGKQVLVEVAAFSVNATDLMARQGKMKGMNGLGFPKGTGVDFSGTVIETGPSVTNLKIGDRVWGYIGMKPPGKHAAAAQFLTIRADQIATVPESIRLGDAAALPLVGLTALQALRGALKVTHGKRVLVVGGSGGVGRTAIQIAAALGATVDAVAGARGDIAERAGAQRVYDYQSVEPSQIEGRYDAILDTATADLRAYRRLLNRGGRIAALTPAALPAILASAFTPGPLIHLVSAKPNADDLAWLARAVDAGSIVPIIDATYPLQRSMDAHRETEAGPAGGKRIVITQRP
ncbi:MAG: NADP-dependent oxidoreductase [Brachybacterium sp.]|nr:NADP-dependent oxidoreductase [Brachybacterium sp.]